MDATSALQSYVQACWRKQCLAEITVNLRQKTSRSPLVGDLYIVEKYVNSGADLDVVEQRGTPCIPNVFWHEDLIRFFVRYGRDINAQDASGNTALHYVMMYTPVISLVELLQIYSANPNIRNVKGETVIFEIIRSRSRTAIPILEFLLDHGAQVNVRNNKGLTILHQRMSPDFIGILINRFEDVDIRCSKYSYEKTPLMVAAEKGDAEVCQYLIDNNANPNLQDLQGYSALHYAVMNKQTRCVNVLLNSGADPNLISALGRDVFQQCSLYGDVECVKHRADPLKLIEMYDMAGAMSVVMGYSKWGHELWEKAQELRSTLDVPNPEISLEQRTLYNITEDYILDGLFKDQGINLYRHALYTIDRISGQCRFWNLLSALSHLILGTRLNNQVRLISEILSNLSETVPLEDTRNVDTDNYVTLDRFVSCMIEELFHPREANGREICALLWPQVQFIAQLCVSCLEKWVQVTKQPTTPFMKLFYQTCFLLSNESYDDNSNNIHLMTKIVILDPRSHEGNGLLHLACKGYLLSHLSRYGSFSSFVNALLDCGANVCALNRMGQTPFQLIRTSLEDKIFSGDLILKMVKLGAHVDCRNANDDCKQIVNVLKERDGVDTFSYLTLQCLAAKTLLNSNVHYKNIVPKRLLEFINMHW